MTTEEFFDTQSKMIIRDASSIEAIMKAIPDADILKVLHGADVHYKFGRGWVRDTLAYLELPEDTKSLTMKEVVENIKGWYPNYMFHIKGKYLPRCAEYFECFDELCDCLATMVMDYKSYLVKNGMVTKKKED
ncbi:MAG: hypothetical protein J1F11_04505 [Oscillospiraceae bacterium]|nr:hypothetical protein [Oscillospiraceae bacterium]